jgi:hypothetical protein
MISRGLQYTSRSQGANETQPDLKRGTKHNLIAERVQNTTWFQEGYNTQADLKGVT